MPEDFGDKSNKAIWALVVHLKRIVEQLRDELPIERLSLTNEISEEDDSFTMRIWGEPKLTELNSFSIHARPIDSPPEPSELYPSNCLARGTLQISVSESVELCADSESWMVHDGERWLPLSASYLAFLIGKAQRAPELPPPE